MQSDLQTALHLTKIIANYHFNIVKPPYKYS